MNDRPPIPPELATVLRQFPVWQYWRGVSDRWYAKRPRSSPPVVLSGETAEKLARLITDWEAGKR
jgi:hypothetical protein